MCNIEFNLKRITQRDGSPVLIKSSKFSLIISHRADFVLYVKSEN